MPNNATAQRSSQEVQTESYYDSSDADRFYEKVWGGEDIHIGLYMDTNNIFEASRKTVEAMTAQLKSLNKNSRVLDLGAGYGGSARYMAKHSGCRVICLNISEVQNQRNRELNAAQGLDSQIVVQHGSFEEIPLPDASVDVIWSQDSFLHSARKDKVMEEVVRVLAPGGDVIFTDPMQADDCPEGVLQPVYDRLDLDSMGSFAWYRKALTERGLREQHMVYLTPQLRNHYANVKEVLESRYDELVQEISKDYMDRMIAGLGHWVDAADQGYLAWGILHFRKPG